MATAPHRTRRFRRDEYHRIAGLGLFAGQRVELLDGEVVEMAAKGIRHVIATSLTADRLVAAFGPSFWVVRQDPIDLDEHSEPEPDVYVVNGSPRDYVAIPTVADALLVIEVADTTLDDDREIKGSLYARGGVADYWIVNLVDRRVEVHRAPGPDLAAYYGHAFAAVTFVPESGVVTPLALSGVTIPVADLLP